MAALSAERHPFRRHSLAASLVAMITVVLPAVLHPADSTGISEPPAGVHLQTESATTSWCPDVCDCYNNLQTLDCSQRRLDAVPAHLPGSARRVYLEDNNISEIKAEELARSRRVSQLVLDRNRLSSVNTAVFCTMTSLQELSLAANAIMSFQLSHRVGCVSVALRQLDLSLNLLTTVPVDLSSFAPRLEILDLSCNEITAATLDSSFTQLKSLRQLDLSRNRIHFLSAADLQPLRDIALDLLNLAETELAAIDDEALCPVSDSLKYLSLTGNPLDADNLARVLARYASRTADATRSGNLTTHNTSELSARRGSETLQSAALPLTRLSIGEMSIGNLTVAMLAPFHQLLVLDAAFSDLEWVDSDLFNHLSSLETLHLEAGRITVIDNLSAMKNLRRVYLQQNQLRQVVSLAGLYSLVFVDLSYNRISHIPAFWLNGFRHLQVMYT